jgi:hypothetical protein
MISWLQTFYKYCKPDRKISNFSKLRWIKMPVDQSNNVSGLSNDLHHQRPTQAFRVSAAALLAVWCIEVS